MYYCQYIFSEFEIGLVCFHVTDVLVVSNFKDSTALAHIFFGASLACRYKKKGTDIPVTGRGGP
jgi:hypothetical protein